MEALFTTRLILYLLLFLCCFVSFFSDAQLLPDEEVQALQTISAKLQLKNFSFNRSFCSSGSVRNSTDGNDIVTEFICSPCNATFCHVTNILLKGQNLTGTLPDEFVNLTFLRQIDLTRNYISGPIPSTFSKIPLTNLSLLGNRISGSIPKEIGNILSLEELVLEDNDLEGTLPQNLGNLSRLKRLLLSANNMTGTIPAQFGNLKALTDLRIDGNRISGKIPDLIGNWPNMIRLDIQGTLMGGPFPSNISLLTNMTELRVLNLNASAIEFPDLRQMKKLKLLILRNCGLTGPMPDYIGGFTNLRTLDLSHNMLTGQIPVAFQSLTLNYMFLNNNSLIGSVPNWVSNSNQNYDISYNNFTELSTVGCQASRVNLVASNAPTASNSVSWCLKQDLSCSSKPQHHSLFVNCGGDISNYDGNVYEEDKGNEGPAFFSPSAEKWAYSSNGVYMSSNAQAYRATNSFGLNVTGGDIYKTARLAPNSLIYYGLCMRKGSYKVRLHFAEITYSDDQTFSSLGKRIFDVAIQGNVILTDFNIAEEAKGVGKEIIKEFPDIHVNGSTLEIHLYWTGKGTTAIPNRGVYGPLISAISVTPNFDISDGGLSAGAIAGIVISSCLVLLAIILVVLWKFGYIGNKDQRDKELEAAIELQTGYFTLRQIKQATNNFDPANKIGEGGFGPVYKGTLSDGAIIAVKQLSSKSKQGNREFVTEIGMISALQHQNLVKLYGCCIEGNQLLLIYEYMENNSLARALFGKEEQRLNLDWPTRKRICIGIAKGLTYLHEESRLKIVHRDIKATNVLLDKDLNAKISDFGLAKLDEEENTHISTRIAGTIGYMAPEYAMRGYLTDKADVYSFGIVALEIVSGKSNTNYRPKEEFVYLLDWAYVLQEQGSLLELVDPILGTHYSRKEALTMLNIGLLCTNPSPTLRPLMSSVVSMLEGKSPIQAPLVKRSSPNEESRFKAFEILSHDSQTNVSSASQESHVKRSMSMDGPWIDSSITSQMDFINHSSSDRLIPDHNDVKN